MAEAEGPVELEEGGSSPQGTNGTQWKKLPFREMSLSLVLMLPCLAHIFAIPFLLYRSAGIVASYNQTSTRPLLISLNETLISDPVLPEIDEERDIFATWPRETIKEKYRKASEAKLLFFMNMGVGSLVAGIASDLIGRKSICNIMIALTVLSGLLATEAPTLETFEFIWCLIAIGTFGTYTGTYIRVVEMLPDSIRTPLHLFVFGFSWTIGRAVGLIVAWLTKDWILIMYWLSIWILVSLLMFYMIPWKFKISEGRRESSDKIWHVFTHRRYQIRLATLSLNWVLLGYIIYTINLSSTRIISNNIFVEMSFKGLLDFISMSLTVFSTYRYKCTLPLFSSFMFMAGVCYLIMSPFGNTQRVGVVMVHLINFISGGNFGILWIVTSYSFPRSFRGTAIGICSFCARIGAAVGVYIVESVGRQQPTALLIIMGLLIITITASMVLILPERSQKPLLETIQSEDDEIKALKEEQNMPQPEPEAQSSAPEPTGEPSTSGGSQLYNQRFSFTVPDSSAPKIPLQEVKPNQANPRPDSVISEGSEPEGSKYLHASDPADSSEEEEGVSEQEPKTEDWISLESSDSDSSSTNSVEPPPAGPNAQGV
eukprot:maker-scaffold560_size136926-snap-gene-0.22 protein:Tk12126 transcript:maker-scaffold560_size136926-snap-gene-0.22-mRNA-1 annotation:"hypothetical protein LOTGIDRAFT_108526"